MGNAIIAFSIFKEVNLYLKSLEAQKSRTVILYRTLLNDQRPKLIVDSYKQCYYLLPKPDRQRQKNYISALMETTATINVQFR